MEKLRIFLSNAVSVAVLTIVLTSTIQAQPQEIEDRLIDAAFQAEAIDSVMEAFREVYVFPEVARKVEDHIRARYQNGEYEGITSPRQFARQLMKDMREISKDGHVGVRYLSDAEAERFLNYPRPDEDFNPIEEARRENFGFKKLEILPGNIGYLDLRGFHDAAFAGATAIAAMNFLANADAIIFDLRQNGGGNPSMIQLISSYLFEQPTHLNSFYIRKSDETRQFWTQASVQGARMADVPVYVLTSDYTFSAAEEFTYNLKNLERATIIGETTGGGAHPVEGHFWANLNLQANIPFGRAINPISGTNWEGTGVEPDIAVPADQALDRAHLEALRKLRDEATDPMQIFTIDWAITGKKVALGDVSFDPKKLPDYAGKYGPRRVVFEDGELFYQRQDSPRHRLIPAGNDLFLLDGLDYFRIQFERDNGGKVTKLIGVYDNGQRDMNERDG